MKKILSLGALATTITIPVSVVACGNKKENNESENNESENSVNSSNQYKDIEVGVKLTELSPTDWSIFYKSIGVNDEVKKDIEEKKYMGYITSNEYKELLSEGFKVLIAHHFNRSMPRGFNRTTQIYEDWKNSSLRDKIIVYHDPHYRSNQSYDDPKNPDDYKLTWT